MVAYFFVQLADSGNSRSRGPKQSGKRLAMAYLSRVTEVTTAHFLLIPSIESIKLDALFALPRGYSGIPASYVRQHNIPFLGRVTFRDLSPSTKNANIIVRINVAHG